MSTEATTVETAPAETTTIETPAAEQPGGTSTTQSPGTDGPLSPVQARRAAHSGAIERGRALQRDFDTRREGAAAADPAGATPKAEETVQPDASSAADKRVSGDTAPEPKDAAVVDEKTGRKRDPATGQFLPEGGDGAGAQDPAAAEGRAEGESPKERPADGGSQPIRVEIDPKHPIRGIGLEAFTAATPLEEQGLRALLNGTYERVKRVESLEAELREERRLRIQAESRQAANAKYQATPEYQQRAEKYQELLETQGKDIADQWWRSPDNQKAIRELQEQEFTERMGQVEQRDSERAEAEFKDTARSLVHPVLAKLQGFDGWFEEEFDAFNLVVLRRSQKDPAYQPTEQDLHDEFRQRLSRRLHSEPAVQQAINRAKAAKENGGAQPGAVAAPAPAPNEGKVYTEADLQRIRQEAIDAFRQTQAAEETRREMPPHGMGKFTGAVHGDRATVTGEEEVDLSGMTPDQIRRHSREQARQVGRAYVPR